jgi:hypothetical protein
MFSRHRSTSTTILLCCVLAGPLGLSLARAEFCVSESVGSSRLAFAKLKLRKGAVNFAPGVRIERFGQAAPATAKAVVNTAGSFAGIAMEVNEVSVGAGGAGLSNLPPTQYSAIFRSTNGKLKPGDTAGGLALGNSATFTVVDCDDVPAIP